MGGQATCGTATGNGGYTSPQTASSKLTDIYSFKKGWGSFDTADVQFDHPAGIDGDSSGNVYVADGDNDRAQKFDSINRTTITITVIGSSLQSRNIGDQIQDNDNEQTGFNDRREVIP